MVLVWRLRVWLADYLEHRAPRWLNRPYMRWRAWARTSARWPGVRRYVRVGRYDVDLLYGEWVWCPRILTARRATMGADVVGVLLLPGKHGLGLSRRTEEA